MATWGHQDSKDLILCKVIPVGTFTGGELVVWEPGLVVELPSGSDIVFSSWKITHFNLDYVGEQASLVLHTDKEMARWVGDWNGVTHQTCLVLWTWRKLADETNVKNAPKIC